MIKAGKEEHILSVIKKLHIYDIKHIIVNVSYLSEKIENFLKINNENYMSLYYEPSPLGVFGGINNIIHSYSTIDFDLLVHNSDIFFDGDIINIVNNDRDIVLGLVKNGKKDFKFDGKEIFLNSDSSNLEWFGYAGIMKISSKIMNKLKNRYKANTSLNFINDFINVLMDEKIKINGVQLQGFWEDFGTIAKLFHVFDYINKE